MIGSNVILTPDPRLFIMFACSQTLRYMRVILWYHAPSISVPAAHNPLICAQYIAYTQLKVTMTRAGCDDHHFLLFDYHIALRFILYPLPSFCSRGLIFVGKVVLAITARWSTKRRFHISFRDLGPYPYHAYMRRKPFPSCC